MIIHINDLHIKNQQPFLDGNRNLFKWLIENYKNETLIIGGDLWDTSSPFAENEAEFIGYIKQFKQVYINVGNHDKSRRAGNSLLHLNHHDNITVFSQKIEIEIEGLKCLFLPYIHNMKEDYETLEWSGDYCFIHGENIEDSFGEAGLKLNNIKAIQIFSHIHMKKEYKNRHVPGVAIPSRNLELNNPILTIENGKINHIDHPVWFDFQTLNYGEFPENKNNILNVKNIPSFVSLYDTYKEYFIRKEGCSLIRTEIKDKDIDKFTNSSSLIDKFISYSKDKEISKEIYDCSIKYIKETLSI